MWRSAIALTLTACAVTTTAWAERSAAVSEARERFDRGIELAGETQYEAALAEFQRAYELSPHYAPLYNIAQVFAHLRRYPEAVTHYERYLEEGGTEVPRGRRAEVQGQLRRLRRLVGRIMVEVTCPGEATVLIDGVEVGQTPLEAPVVVNAGEHRVSVTAEGYVSVSRQVTVAGDVEESVVICMAAAHAPGGIRVISRLPGALIELDGVEVAETPRDDPITASAGHHTVSLTRQGYETARGEVEVQPGEVVAVELSPRPRAELPPERRGDLELALSEEDAEVLVDGEPYVDGLLPAGPHLVEIGAPGFEPWSQRVELAGGATLRLEANLRPTPAHLERYEARARQWRVAAWSTLAVGVAILGTSIGLIAWNRGRTGDWQAEDDLLAEQMRCIPDPSCQEVMTAERAAQRQAENETLQESLEQVTAIEWSLFALGLITAGVATYLFLGGPRPGRYTRVGISPSRGGVAFALSWAL